MVTFHVASNSSSRILFTAITFDEDSDTENTQERIVWKLVSVNFYNTIKTLYAF